MSSVWQVVKIPKGGQILIQRAEIDANPGNEAEITAAVGRFNEQLAELPETIYCPLEGLYPEFDSPDYTPEIYLTMVENKATLVGRQIEQALADR